MTNILETETMRKRFYEDFAMYPCAEQQHILAFIESELALRDAHHKALRAKELREIAEKIKHLQCLLPDEAQKELNVDFESYDDYCTGQMMAKSQALRIVDELIEKPTT